MAGRAASSGPPALETHDPVLAAFAAEVGVEDAVTVAGGRTRWDRGGPLAAGARELAAPAGIVAYTPAEMTVVVRAGTTVAELRHELGAHGQRSALPERGGTVGGAVAVGENHLDRRARGTVAVSVLQVRYVSAEGRLITGGGPTVKNVTGFDLPRLMTGSLGTLGLLCELILRTNPIPALSRWLAADGADPFAVDAALLRPSAILWDGARTWVHLEGHEPDVAADIATLGGLGSFTEVGGPPELPCHRWSLEPGRLRSLGREGLPADGLPAAPFVASVGVGTVWAAGAQPMPEPAAALAAISRQLKDNFDPTGRLNPGRRVGW
ncbi:MAG: FAD-binding protein [Acidimicrobiia bacterium]|nr:FAD-binding protein [Acidimicrobiia bacterium]MDH4362993.1 FAD-binding protein [Acidimicrobiia bacterium]